MIPADALEQRIDVRTPGDLVLDAIDLLSSRQPEWVPRNGAPEVIYLEALATVVAEVVSTADAILSAVVESALANLYLLPRLAGTSATCQLKLDFDSPVTLTIPTGTVFLMRDFGVELACTADTSVVANTVLLVPAATVLPTAEVNGIALGTAGPIDVMDDIPNLSMVSIYYPLSGGIAPESDAEYSARGVNRLARITSSLVVPDHFTAWVLEDGRASNASAIAAWDGAAIGTAGTDAGHVTVCVWGLGTAMDPADRADLAAAMQEATAAGVTVHVVDAVRVSVAVTTTVHPLPGWASGDVSAAVDAAIRAHLDPETWIYGETVRTTTLTTVIAGADGVDYVTSMTAPAADVTLTANQVAMPGTLTITVA